MPKLVPPGPTAVRRSGPQASGAGRSARAEGRRQQQLQRRRLLVVFVTGTVSVALAVLSAAVAAGRAGTGTGARIGPTWLVLLGASALSGLGALAAWPRQDAGRWARGAAGEEATASLLGRLNGRRWVVMHDLGLPGSRANVDHLVIGPTGVWVIDSKAYRGRLVAKGGELHAGKARVSTEAVRWEADVVTGVLGERARPLVAVHGHGLGRRGRRCGGVRVLPAESVARRVRRWAHLRPELSPKRVAELAALAGSHLVSRAGGARGRTSVTRSRPRVARSRPGS